LDKIGALANTMDYVTLFDVSQKGYNWFPGIIGFIFTMVGVAGLRDKKFRKSIKPHPIVPLILGVTVGIGAMWFQYENRRYYELLLLQDRAWVVVTTGMRHSLLTICVLNIIMLQLHPHSTQHKHMVARCMKECTFAFTTPIVESLAESGQFCVYKQRNKKNIAFFHALSRFV
jgi:hypothetical protein